MQIIKALFKSSDSKKAKIKAVLAFLKEDFRSIKWNIKIKPMWESMYSESKVLRGYKVIATERGFPRSVVIETFSGHSKVDFKFCGYSYEDIRNIDQIVLLSWSKGLVGMSYYWNDIQIKLWKGEKLIGENKKLFNILSETLNKSKKFDINCELFSCQRIHPENGKVFFPAFLATTTASPDVFAKKSGAYYSFINCPGIGVELEFSDEREILFPTATSWRVLETKKREIYKGDEEYEIPWYVCEPC